MPKTTLEQWRTLQAVVDFDSYAKAAEYLNKSQSSVSYLVGKLETLLGVEILRIEGRKAKLTDIGTVLLARSRHVTQDVRQLENIALQLEQGWEAEIQLVVDSAFPSESLFSILDLFKPLSQGTRVQVSEVVISGADEALISNKADLVIGSNIPSNFTGDELIPVPFVAVAHPSHSLHQLNRPLSFDDLIRHTQIIIRDSGRTNQKDVGWLDAEHRWTVSSISMASAAIMKGLGFGWLPQHVIQKPIESGELKLLPLINGKIYTSMLYLIYGNPSFIRPATQLLANLFKQHSKSFSAWQINDSPYK